jgi:pilus assembly protein FimV
MAREQQGSPAGEKRLEQYGVWVKVKPRRVLDTPEQEESFQLSDLDTSRSPSVAKAPAPDESALTAEEEKLLDDLETELDGDKSSSDVLVPDEEPLLAEEEGELPEIEGTSETGRASRTGESDEELPTLEEAEPAQRAFQSDGEVEVTLSENASQEEHFDDLEALESELATVASAPRASAGSSEILSRIEDELRSIRTDLTQLRSEISGLRKGGIAPAAEAPASAADAQGGFFDEDEDETIALTGDELDNILNTADITEESVETPSVDSGTSMEELASSSPLQEDILSYDTPSISDGNLEVLEKDIDSAEELTPMEDSLDLSEGLSPLSAAEVEELPEVALEELPSELVLEESGSETKAPSDGDASVPQDLNIEELSELDLEGIPEMEAEDADLAGPLEPVPVETEGPLSEESSRSDETIDLATLDLGEEPTVIDAVPEQVDDLESIPEAESLEGPEEAPEAESGNAAESVDALTEEVDLEALAAEAEELTSDEAVPPADDLEIGELEGVTDDGAEGPAPEKEIEIEFESEPEGLAEAESVEELDLESAEQVLESEEVSAAETAPAAKKSGGGIPAHLQDEIRTVLKYMDHLLEALPDEKIKEFAGSDYFVMYKKLFEDLGLGE